MSAPPRQSEARYWTPKEGDVVWFNHPDSPDPMGTVVGFVAEGHVRAGQPIIRREHDEPGSFGRKAGNYVTHPIFLLPFPCGGEEWKRALAEGRVKVRAA